MVIKNKLLVGFACDDELKKKLKITMLSILRILGKQTGLLLDYSHDTLYYKRIVYKTKKEHDIEAAY